MDQELKDTVLHSQNQGSRAAVGDWPANPEQEGGLDSMPELNGQSEAKSGGHPARRRVSRFAASTREIVKTLVSLVILAGGLGFVVMMAMRDRSAAMRPPESLMPMVSVVTAEEYSGPLELTLSGSVVPFREIRVSAEVSGVIVYKAPECRAGNYVREGTPLMVIDRQNYELEVATAAAELRQSEAMIREIEEEIRGLESTIELSQSEVSLIQRELDRNARLPGVSSRSEIEQWERNLLAAQSQLVSRQNNLGTARTRLDRMKAGLDLAKRKHERAVLNLERTNIRAPSDGVIVAENAQQGDLVAVGSPVFAFEDTRHAEILVNLSNHDLQWLQEHLPAAPTALQSNELSVQDAYHLPAAEVQVFDTRDPTVIWRGRLSRFDGIGRDELTRATPVRITVDNPIALTAIGPRALVRGMFVRCRIVVSGEDRHPDDRMVAIPAQGLRPGNYVWTVEDARLRRHAVEVVGVPPEDFDHDVQDRLVVLRWKSGSLEPGAQVVVSPLSQMAPGIEVQIGNGPTSAGQSDASRDVPGKVQSLSQESDAGT